MEFRDFCLTIVFSLQPELHIRQVKPFNIAEVLTMRQLVALGIHTHGTLEDTGIVGFEFTLESEVVAVTTYNLSLIHI